MYAQSNNHYARVPGVLLWTFQLLYITVLPSWENPSKPHTFLTTLPPVNTKLINTHMFRNLGGEAKPSEMQRTILREVARMALPCAVRRGWTSNFICSDRDRILILMMTTFSFAGSGGIFFTRYVVPSMLSVEVVAGGCFS